jgi:hypothetical protein
MPINTHFCGGRDNHATFNPVKEADSLEAQLHTRVDHLQLGDIVVKTVLGGTNQIGLKVSNLVQQARAVQGSCVRRLILFRKVGFAKLLNRSILFGKLISSLNRLLQSLLIIFHLLF